MSKFWVGFLVCFHACVFIFVYIYFLWNVFLTQRKILANPPTSLRFSSAGFFFFFFLMKSWWYWRYKIVKGATRHFTDRELASPCLAYSLSEVTLPFTNSRWGQRQINSSSFDSAILTRQILKCMFNLSHLCLHSTICPHFPPNVCIWHSMSAFTLTRPYLTIYI